MTATALPAVARLQAICQAYESLTPESLGTLAALYAPNSRFSDPFNSVQGRAAVARVFSHMYEQVHEPRFQVDSAAAHGDVAFLSWTMSFGDLKANGPGNPRSQIVGCTRLRFDGDGLVAEHVDFWDPAAQLYEKVPVLGWVMRFIRGRLATPAA
jgi:steroid Delta-isomerase